MDDARLDQELTDQARRLADLMRRGCHGAMLEDELAEFLAWFEIWRHHHGLPDSGVWPADALADDTRSG